MKRVIETYESPRIEVIEMENEGVIALSGNGTLPGVGNGGSAFGSGARRAGSYRSAGSSDLEDLINDILTIEP